MARPRNKSNSKLPDNLYRFYDQRTGREYYRYRDPRSGKFYGLGTDFSSAVSDAKALNAAIYASIDKSHLVKIMDVSPDDGSALFSEAVSRHIDIAIKLHAKERIADNTLKAKRSLSSIWNARLGKKPINSISVRDIAQVLTEYADSGKERMAQALRSEAIEIFKTAIAEGLCSNNPASLTRNPSPEIKRSRLSFEVFKAVYDACKHVWLKNAMALAIVTAQRREDISLARFSDIRDGYWWCIQAKTKNRIAIPLELRLEVLGLSVGDVIRQCRSTGIVSNYLIHQTRPRGNSPVGSPIWKDTISKAFHEEIMAIGVEWGGKSPPTFHEIRSLSERLYTAQGNVNTQNLLGHKDPRSTSIYKDTRGSEWIMVQAR
jgi:integrase